MSECCDNIKSGVVISVRGNTLRVRDDDGNTHVVRVEPGNRVPQLDQRILFDCDKGVAITTPRSHTHVAPRKRSFARRGAVGARRKVYGPIAELYVDTRHHNPYIDPPNPLDGVLLTLAVSFVVVDDQNRTTQTYILSVSAIPEAFVMISASYGYRLASSLDGRYSFYASFEQFDDLVMENDAPLFLGHPGTYGPYGLAFDSFLVNSRVPWHTHVMRFSDYPEEGFGVQILATRYGFYEVGDPKRESCDCTPCGYGRHKHVSYYRHEQDARVRMALVDPSAGSLDNGYYDQTYSRQLSIDSATCTTRTRGTHLTDMYDAWDEFQGESGWRSHRVLGATGQWYGRSKIYTSIEPAYKYYDLVIEKKPCCIPENQDCVDSGVCDDEYRTTYIGEKPKRFVANDPDGRLLLRIRSDDVVADVLTGEGFCIYVDHGDSVRSCTPHNVSRIDFANALYPGIYWSSAGPIAQMLPRIRRFDSDVGNFAWSLPTIWTTVYGWYANGSLRAPPVAVGFDVELIAKLAKENIVGDVSGTEQSFLYRAFPTSHLGYTSNVRDIVIPICPMCDSVPLNLMVNLWGKPDYFHILDSYTTTTKDAMRPGHELLSDVDARGNVWVVIGDPPRIFQRWLDSGKNLDSVVGATTRNVPALGTATLLWLRDRLNASEIGLPPQSFAFYGWLPRTVDKATAYGMAERIHTRDATCDSWWCYET